MTEQASGAPPIWLRTICMPWAKCCNCPTPTGPVLPPGPLPPLVPTPVPSAGLFVPSSTSEAALTVPLADCRGRGRETEQGRTGRSTRRNSRNGSRRGIKRGRWRLLRVRARVQRVSRAEPRPRARPHLQAHADVGEAQGRGHRRVRAVLGGQPCRAAGRREYGGAGERENGRTGEEGGLEGAGGAVVTGRHGHTGTGCRPCAHVLKPCAHGGRHQRAHGGALT